MTAGRRELLAAILVLVVGAAVTAATIATHSTGEVGVRSPRLAAPFASGETWYVCDGYERGAPALVLTPDSRQADSGCPGSVPRAGGHAIVAPGDARVARLGDGAVCLDLDSGGSFEIRPVAAVVAVDAHVTRGDVIGTVPDDASGVRLELWGDGACEGDALPFDSQHDGRFVCSADDPDVVAACPQGRLGPPDLDQACADQYPGEGRAARSGEPGNPYAWVCAGASGTGGIDVARQCLQQYGLDAVSEVGKSGGWICRR